MMSSSADAICAVMSESPFEARDTRVVPSRMFTSVLSVSPVLNEMESSMMGRAISQVKPDASDA
jgi:hypothetical protein